MPHALREFDDCLAAALLAAAIVPPAQIAWQNRTFVPTKGSSYLSVSMAARAHQPLGFGIDSVAQWVGTYQVSVFVPRDAGTREQATLAQRILAAFPRGLNLPLASGGSNLIVSDSSAGAPFVFNDWSNLPVQVSWFALDP
jgi:hypothetical protein